ncbi:MAG: hypothetical protein ACM31M_06690 [Nitrososphaerota archaeon]
MKKCNHNYERIKLPDKHTIFIQAGTGENRIMTQKVIEVTEA